MSVLQEKEPISLWVLKVTFLPEHLSGSFWWDAYTLWPLNHFQNCILAAKVHHSVSLAWISCSQLRVVVNYIFWRCRGHCHGLTVIYHTMYRHMVCKFHQLFVFTSTSLIQMLKNIRISTSLCKTPLQTFILSYDSLWTIHHWRLFKKSLPRLFSYCSFTVHLQYWSLSECTGILPNFLPKPK